MGATVLATGFAQEGGNRYPGISPGEIGLYVSTENSIFTKSEFSKKNEKNDAKYVDANISNKTIKNSNIIGGKVSSSQLQNDKVDSADIVSSTITGGVFYDAKIKNGSIGGGTSLIGGSATSASVQNAKMDDVTTQKNTIKKTTIINSNLRSDKIFDSTISSSKITNAQINGSVLNSINAKDSVLYKDKIVNSTVGGGTVRESEVVKSTIDGGNIIKSTISGNSKLTDSGKYTTVSGNDVANSKINGSTAKNRTIKDSTVNKSKLINGVAKNTHVTNSTLTNVTSSNVTVSGSTFSGGSVSGSILLKDTITKTGITFSKVDNSTVQDAVLKNTQVSGTTLVNTTNTNVVSVRSVLKNVASILEVAINDTVDNSKLNKAKISNSTINNGTVTNSTVSGSTLKKTDSKSNNIFNCVLNGIKSIGDHISNSSFIAGIVEKITSVSNGFNGTSLAKAKISGGSISGNSIVKDSDVRGANVRNSTIKNTEINASKLNGVVIENSTVSGGTLKNSTLKNVTVQNQKDFMTITKQPEDLIVKSGEKATLTLTATGKISAYKWSYKASGSSVWKDLGSGNPCYLNITSKMNGGTYRCMILDPNGNMMYSNVASITIATGNTLKIKTQPKDISAVADTDVTLTCDAEGDGLTYQWQWHDAGETTWSNSWGTGKSIKKTVRDTWDGRVFRCVVTDIDGNKVTSQTKTITVGFITSQPVDQYAAIGEKVSFEITAKGVESYQWYFSKDNGTTWNKSSSSGYNTSKLTIDVTEARVGQSYKCRVMVAGGRTIDSKSARMYEKLNITKQPTDAVAAIGSNVNFSVSASGAKSYQWYYSQDSGKTWKKSSVDGFNTNKITVQATENRIGQMYRCRLTGSDGKTLDSTAGKVSAKIVISKQPSNVSAAIGNNVTFETVASGAKSYQWYYSQDDGQTWKKSSTDGCNTNKITIQATEGRIGQMYRCRLTGFDGNTLDSAAAKIIAKLTITNDPVNVNAVIGEIVNFEVGALGVKSYQWYYSQDNGQSWKKSSVDGCTTNKITVQVTEGRIGQRYRCNLTGFDGKTIDSAAAKINAVLSITSQPVDVNASIGSMASFEIGALGAKSYQWYYSQDNGQNWKKSSVDGCNTNKITVQVTEKRIGQMYRCSITSADGAEIISDSAKIKGNSSLMAQMISTKRETEFSLVELDEVIAEIKEQPVDAAISEEDEAIFEVVAEGAVSYQWYYSVDGLAWEELKNADVVGADTSKLIVPIDESVLLYSFRCEIMTESGDVLISDSVKIVKKCSEENDCKEIFNDVESETLDENVDNDTPDDVIGKKDSSDDEEDVSELNQENIEVDESAIGISDDASGSDISEDELPAVLESGEDEKSEDSDETVKQEGDNNTESIESKEGELNVEEEISGKDIIDDVDEQTQEEI